MALATAGADPIETWESLRAQPRRRAGLFATWDVDQQKVLTALRAAERAERARLIQDLERRVREDPVDLEARDLLGLAYRRRGQLSNAAAQFRAVLAVAPTFRSSRLNLAELYVDLGRTDLAADELAELVRLEPALAHPRRVLGALYTQLGRHGEAAAVLRPLLRLAPTDLDLHVGLARSLLRSGQPDAAKALLDSALRLAPDGPTPRLLLADCYRSSGDWAAARKELEALRKAHPDSDAAPRLALVHLHQGDFQAARAVFQDAVGRRSSDPVLAAGATVAAQGAGDSEGAIKSCVGVRTGGNARLAVYLLANLWLAQGDGAAIRAVASSLPTASPNLAVAYDDLLAMTEKSPQTRRQLALDLNLARLYAAFEWYDEAIEAALSAQRIAPRSVLVGEVLAQRYAAAGRRDDELRVRQNLTRERPDAPAAAIALVQTYLARDQDAQARGTCRELLKRFPDDPEALLAAADLACRHAEFSAAAADSRKVLAANPREDRALRLLLDALLAQRDFKAAAEAIRARQRADRSFVPGPLEQATLAAASGQSARAIEQCELGLGRSPRDGRLRFLAGLLCEEKGDWAGAIAQFEVAHWVEPRSLPAHMHLARAALRVGRSTLAVSAYRGALAVASDLVALHLELADALDLAGRPAEAIAHLSSLAPAEPAARRAVNARIAQEHFTIGDAALHLLLALAITDAVLTEDPSHDLARRAAVGVYRRLGDLAGAAKLYECILARAPQADVDAELGLLRLALQQPEEAAERLGRAAGRAKGPARFELLKWQAAAHLALGSLNAARAATETALAARPAAAPPTAILAIVLAASGLEAESKHELSRLAKSDPETAEWLQALATRLGRDRGLLVLVIAAHAAAADGWRAQAAGLFGATVARAPDEPSLHHALILARESAGQAAAALDAARGAARRWPNSATVHFRLARALDGTRQGAAALDEYRRAAALLGKRSPDLWAAIAERFSAAGRMDDAIEAYRMALALDPQRPATCNNLAWLYATHRPDQLGEAERLAAAAVQKEPQAPAFRDTLGWVYFLRRKHGDAAREIGEALAQVPTSPTYLYHMGMVHFALGRRGPARRLLRRALALDPNLPDAETARAVLKLLTSGTSPPGGS